MCGLISVCMNKADIIGSCFFYDDIVVENAVFLIMEGADAGTRNSGILCSRIKESLTRESFLLNGVGA